MVTQKINLGTLKSTIRTLKGKSGEVECIIIPIKENRLYKGQKGVYLDIVGFEVKNQTEGMKDTHILKQSFKKEIREKMTEEELQKIPILGNMTDWDKVTEVNEPEEVKELEIDVKDDLPF